MSTIVPDIRYCVGDTITLFDAKYIRPRHNRSTAFSGEVSAFVGAQHSEAYNTKYTCVVETYM